MKTCSAAPSLYVVCAEPNTIKFGDSTANIILNRFLLNLTIKFDLRTFAGYKTYKMYMHGFFRDHFK